MRAETLVLATLAGLVAFAGAVALAQALTRQAYSEAGDDATLRAIGMGRGQMLATAVLRSIFIALVGAFIAWLVAWRLSPHLLLSLARKASLEHGTPARWTAFWIGAGSIFVFTVLSGALSALFIERSLRRGDAEPRARSARRFGAPLRQAWLPVPSVLGARFALQRGRRTAPAWTTIAGVGLCVAMLAFASTFTEHLRRDLSERQRYGWNWDVKIGAPALPDIAGPIVPGLREQPGLSDLSVGAVTQAEVQGVRVDVLALDSIVGNAVPTIARGRAPRTPYEIALGGRTMRRVHTNIGDTVAARIGTYSLPYRIVGQAIFPEFGDSGQLGTGSFMTVGGLHRILPDAPRDAFYVRLQDAPNPTARATQLSAVLGPLPAHTDARPEDLVNLSRGDGLLVELMLLLVALAIAMLVHVLVTGIRTGWGSHATLRALGYTRGQSRATVAWSSATLAAVSFVLGAPLGFLVGRWVWSTFATRLGIGADPFVPLVSIALTVTAAIGAALLAAIPAMWLVNRRRVAAPVDSGG